MRKLLLSLAFFCTTITGFAQASTTVEKSIWNAQTGILGIYINNESRLTGKLALRTEVGLDAGFATNSNDTKWGLMPAFNIEPRFYYNIEKRANKGRNTSGNAANYLALLVKYNPDWFLITGDDNVVNENMIAIVPKWGIRRNIGQSKFNYEAGIGIGYYSYIGPDRRHYDYPDGVAVDLHLRIGYRFK